MLVLTQAQRDEIIQHAMHEAPNECCGILIGTVSGERRIVAQVHPVQNVWEGDRTHRFMIDPKTHLRLQREARESLQTVIGFYHSHPTGSANPSAFDAELAWPDHSYLIVSLGSLQSWRLDEQSHCFIEEEIFASPCQGGGGGGQI